MHVPPRSALIRYGGSLVAVALMICVRFGLSPLMGQRQPFTTFYFAVIFSAWFGGLGPSIQSLVLSCLSGAYFFLPPYYAFQAKDPGDLVGMSMFIAVCAAIITYSQSNRAARGRLEREVGERQRAEEAEHEQRERLQATLSSVGDGVIVADAQGRVVSLNPVAEALTGWSSGEAAGHLLRQVFRAVDGVTHDTAEMHVSRVVGEGEIIRQADHTDLISRGGEVRAMEHTIAPIKDDRERITGLVVVFRDTTERRRAERALRESEERFRLAAEAVNGIIYDADTTAGRVERTRGLSEVLGYRPDEVPPTTAWWRQQIDPDDLERSDELASRMLAAGDRYATEYRIRHRDGHFLHVMDRGVVSRDEAGRVVRQVGCTQDITEIRQAEEALREADRRKDEFLAVLAHELRNPLAPIRNALHLMRHPARAGHGFEADRAMAERQVVHLARLVDDLMDVSRISRGKIELRKEVVELSSVVERAIESVPSSLRERGHGLSVSLPHEPIRLEADTTRLEQVFDNLLSNAIKYTEPGGQIRLEAERVGGEVLVRVRDTGIGIEPEMLPRIFQMFVQAEHRPDRSQGGLGIGLSLVKTMIEMHGGSITVHSNGPGTGSEFVVRLPVLPDTPEERVAAVRGQRPQSDPMLSRRRILVVDDNLDAANSLAKLLSRLYGQEVRVANDGPSALEAAGQFQPEVILLDIGLPGMTGYEVAERLRGQPEFESTLIVALTGWGQEDDRQRSHQAGFDHHLVKPVAPEILRDLLADRPYSVGEA